MGKVKFAQDPDTIGEYYCCCEGPCSADHSGDYYPAADYEAVERELKESKYLYDMASERIERDKEKISALERRLEEAQAAEKAAYENTDSVLHTLTKDCELLQRRLAWLESTLRRKDVAKERYIDKILRLEERLAEVGAERDRLREVLVKMSEWGCNGQCVELAGVQCPCCIATAALWRE